MLTVENVVYVEVAPRPCSEYTYICTRERVFAQRRPFLHLDVSHGWSSERCQALLERGGVPSDLRERSSELVARVERACLAHQARCPPQELGASRCASCSFHVCSSCLPVSQMHRVVLVDNRKTRAKKLRHALDRLCSRGIPCVYCACEMTAA